MFKKILIANRGEVALRILRACRDLGIQTVAVHSTADAEAMHVRLADESVCIGPAPALQSYCNAQAMLSAAIITGADALHPGFGFLSEEASFAQMVEDHGLCFIGPSPRHIALMGDKIAAKATAASLGLTTVPGSEKGLDNLDAAHLWARSLGYPLLIKASGGGGGRGMRVVSREEDLEDAYNTARSEAQMAFGNSEVYIEKYLDRPRHIEMQILADQFGHVVTLGERDCSLQRRRQKVWEEAPSPSLSPEVREALCQELRAAFASFGYQGLGTLEFLYQDACFYFMEMNTRLQVEHPVTELVTGLDLVCEQIRVAAGEPLSYTQEAIVLRGHALECRINAESPLDFTPSPGTITSYHAPGGPGVRVDSALYTGATVSPHYDSLVAKLLVHGRTRDESLARMKRALDEYVIGGVQTLLPFHRALVRDPHIQAGEYHIRFLEDHAEELRAAVELPGTAESGLEH
ncbi:MAG: acetyl-CoA carboxylase biotin carboxylase subunit [Holosporales bacterium]|jgi:acetyl-CoA carboxylase biotin carboxylase subunit|nr:acetyl-CoA carboxylase biotin carboxylase subunit [Holosporales bacterium]